MWVFAGVIQLVALVLLTISVFRWSGRWQGSLQGRRRGWPFYRFLALWAPLQGIAMIPVAMEFETSGEEHILIQVGMLLWVLGIFGLIFVATPVFSLLGFVWAPRFLLPSWVKERILHGDPVNTEAPRPEVQPFLAHPRNQPLTEDQRLDKEVKEKYEVDVGGWVIGAVATSLSALVLLYVALGVGPLGLEVGQRAPIGVTTGGRVLVTPENIMGLRLRYGVVGLVSLALAMYFIPKVFPKIRQARETRVAEAQERAERGLPPR